MVTTKTYTFSNVTSDHTIAATFERDNVTLTLGGRINDAVFAGFSGQNFAIRYKIDSGSWTTVTFAGTANVWEDLTNHQWGVKSSAMSTISVPYGSVVTLEATSSPTGYDFDSWTNPAGTWGGQTSSIQVTMTSDMTAYVVYQGETYTITASKTGDGTIAPSGAVTVYRGEDKEFTITADANNHILEIQVDGSPIPLE